MRRRAVEKAGMPSVFAALMLCVAYADASAERLLPRFADAAVQGFDSKMRDSAVQRFDSPMKSSRMQGFESRMMPSPVSRFESRITNSAIQRFDSQMMYSPAQRVYGLGKPSRFFTMSFYPIYVPLRLVVPITVQEIETPPVSVSRATASPQFISLRCGAFIEITVGESEILSQNEEAPCGRSGEDSTDRDETNHLNGGRF
jgi:hypothetical protein